MSWQAYVDTNLVGTGSIDKGAILGHDGSEWARSASFGIAPTEAQWLAANFSNETLLHEKGVQLEGKKHIVLNVTDRSVYLKEGKNGACCVKTKQAILIGHYNESMQPGSATLVTEKLADYLISVGY